MAEQPQTQMFSTFPNPSDFLWKEFTPDKIARFEEAKKAWEDENPDAASSKTVTLIPDLPDDISCLQPPPEPPNGAWRALAGVWTVGSAVHNLSIGPVHKRKAD